MSVTSKYKLAEQALRIISGGTPTNDAQVTMQEVMIELKLKTDKFLKKLKEESKKNKVKF